MTRSQDQHGRRHHLPPVRRPCGKQIPEVRGRSGGEECQEVARREEQVNGAQPELPAMIGARITTVWFGFAHSFEYGAGKNQAMGGPVRAVRKCATLHANSLIQEPKCSSLRRMYSSTSRMPATSLTAESAPWCFWRSAWDGRCSSKARRASAKPSWPRRWPRSPTGG